MLDSYQSRREQLLADSAFLRWQLEGLDCDLRSKRVSRLRMTGAEWEVARIKRDCRDAARVRLISATAELAKLDSALDGIAVGEAAE